MRVIRKKAPAHPARRCPVAHAHAIYSAKKNAFALQASGLSAR